LKKLEEALIVPERVFIEIIEKSIKTMSVSHRSSIDETNSNNEDLQEILDF
jgi:hypothetical protein